MRNETNSLSVSRRVNSFFHGLFSWIGLLSILIAVVAVLGMTLNGMTHPATIAAMLTPDRLAQWAGWIFVVLATVLVVWAVFKARENSLKHSSRK